MFTASRPATAPSIRELETVNGLDAPARGCSGLLRFLDQRYSPVSAVTPMPLKATLSTAVQLIEGQDILADYSNSVKGEYGRVYCLSRPLNRSAKSFALMYCCESGTNRTPRPLRCNSTAARGSPWRANGLKRF